MTAWFKQRIKAEALAIIGRVIAGIIVASTYYFLSR